MAENILSAQKRAIDVQNEHIDPVMIKRKCLSENSLALNNKDGGMGIQTPVSGRFISTYLTRKYNLKPIRPNT
jgi:hypothetical protein